MAVSPSLFRGNTHNRIHSFLVFFARFQQLNWPTSHPLARIPRSPPPSPLLLSGAMEDVSYPVFSPRKPSPAAPPAEQPPPPPPHALGPGEQDTLDAARVPFAQPVPAAPPALLRLESNEFGTSLDNRHVLLRTTIKLVVFHWLNSILGAAGFTIVAGGTLLSLVLLPLCCAGLFVFRAVVYLVGVLAEMDVGLFNFISPPESHVFVSVPRNAAAYGLHGERLSPELSRPTSRTLVAAVYFATVKFGIGLLSSLVLSIAFSLPVGAVARGDLGDNFHGFFGFLVFLLASALLLAVGIPLMFYVARLSRVATRYFCCEKFSAYEFVQPQDASQPQPATYGATGVYANV